MLRIYAVSVDRELSDESVLIVRRSQTARATTAGGTRWRL
jgi:hypothetical protein